MSVDADTDWGAAAEPQAAIAAPGSLLSDLRKRAAELRDDDHVDLELPGWNGRLVARYRALERAQLDPLLERAMGKHGDATAAMADALCLAHVELFGVDVDGSYVELFADQPARFDLDLAEALQLTPQERTARGVLLAVFGAPNERAAGLVNAQFREYAEWLNGEVDGTPPTQEVINTAVGESRPG
jgi:hypothetical protein